MGDSEVVDQMDIVLITIIVQVVVVIVHVAAAAIAAIIATPIAVAVPICCCHGLTVVIIPIVAIPIVAIPIVVAVANVAIAGPIDAAAVIVVTALGDMAHMQHHHWCCWQGSTHNPPHKQWLVRLEVGAWLLVAVSFSMGGWVISGMVVLE